MTLDDIYDLLVDHLDHGQPGVLEARCACGWSGGDHTEHVAEVLLPRFAQAVNHGWNRGWAAAMRKDSVAPSASGGGSGVKQRRRVENVFLPDDAD